MPDARGCAARRTACRQYRKQTLAGEQAAPTVTDMPLLTPAHPTLRLPGTDRDGNKRVLRRPDLRHLVTPRLSGEPVGDEISWDDLVVHRTWREYETAQPGAVRYLMYELSQKDPGMQDYARFYKAVRVTRLTRVPRYLRQAGASGNLVFEQQRDMLAALRENGSLFLNIIAKAPGLPMIFAYGVQGIGNEPGDARTKADEAFAVLEFQLQGLFQQLEYAPITLQEGEALTRYQNEWNHIAMGRGRPLPTGGSLGAGSVLDGNRTDVESTLNQLEAFLRGMGDKSFMLSLVTVPVSPADMTLAWRNITKKLSAVRSEQQGQRSYTAGVALPLGFGDTVGDTHGNTHSSGSSEGVGIADSSTQTAADSFSHTDSSTAATSINESISSSTTAGQSQAGTQTQTDNIGKSVASGETTGRTETSSEVIGASNSQNQTHGVAESLSHGVSGGQSISETQSASQNQATTHGASLTQTHAAGASSSAGASSTESATWGNNLGQSTNAGQSQTDSSTQTASNNLGQAFNLGSSSGDMDSSSNSNTESSNIGAGIPGVFSGSSGAGAGSTETTTETLGSSLGYGQTHSSGSSAGITNSAGHTLSEGTSWGESLGGGQSAGQTQTNSITQTEALAAGQTIAATQGTTIGQSHAFGQSAGQTQTAGQSSSQSVGQTQSLSRSVSTGQSLSSSASLSETASVGRAVSHGQTLGTSSTQTAGSSLATGSSQTAGVSDTVGRSSSVAVGHTASSQQAVNDAYAVAMSRSVGQTTSLGAIPSFGVSFSKATFDEAKRILGNVLEAQMQRYMEGIESGAYLYQMFLQTPDRETLVGASALLKAAFWGPGTRNDRLPQPFHMIVDFDSDETGRLLAHSRVFTSYRRREPVMDIVEPFIYSSFVTPGEAAAFCHPPTSEASGLLAVHDSMPVLAMPAGMAGKELQIGHIVNGERGRVTEVGYGLDADEVTHTLVAGTTGSGKTTTTMRLLTNLCNVSRELRSKPTRSDPTVNNRTVQAGILALDWGQGMRDLASVVDEDRFRFFSVSKPQLGRFRWNPLAVPDNDMNPVEWANAVADNMTISFSLGEYGRSLIAEFVTDLYNANRLVDYELRAANIDDNGEVLRTAIILPAIDRATLPAGAVALDPAGNEIANVITCPALSRLIGMEHLAVLTAAKVEELATVEGARMHGTSMRDRIQSLWRRVQYFAPGSPMSEMIACDDTLDDPRTLNVNDIINPDIGLVTVIEAEGLDLANRRFVLGSVLMAVWRYGQHHGNGVFDHNGQGPGTWICMEEAHELFGTQGEDEDAFSAATRTALYESMFRRARALGMRLVAVVQNCSSIPEAVTSNTSTVLIHRQYADADRKRAFSLLNWSTQLNQQTREWRYLGEMPTGWLIARRDAKHNYLESAPVQIVADPAGLAETTDQQLIELARRRQRN